MRIGDAALGHLTYCTNIHPGESWDEVRANLESHVTAVRSQVCPDAPFGIGLRLSAAAAEALSEPGTLGAFRSFLDDNGFYVFTINGFPYGPFHGVRVKEDVYLPDWMDAERLRYTNQLADLLAVLMPAEEGLSGSVSTVPGAFKPRVASDADVAAMRSAMVRHAAHLAGIEARTGRTIALALEPEPCCFIETIAESVRFFEDHLFAKAAIEEFAALTGRSEAAAEEGLRRHLGLCLDLCHAAVEFEDPQGGIDALQAAGIGIAKLQISAGLRLPTVDAAGRAALEPFADGVYLHQVVERTRSGLKRFTDLPQAFAALDGDRAEREWRVHFHVPIFLDDLGAFATTQGFIAETLDRHRRAPISQHLEVETYTWDVLPERYRMTGIDQAVARELHWVMERLSA